MVVGCPSGELKDAKIKGRQTTIKYWRKLLKKAGQDPDTIELLALEREPYRTFVGKRVADVQKWEETKGEKGEMPRSQRIDLNPQKTCKICMKTCRTIRGLKTHIQRMHKQRRAEEHLCGTCNCILKTVSAKINHVKSCAKKNPKNTYPATRPSEDGKPCGLCGMTITKSNWARNKNRCGEKHAGMVAADPTGER